MDRIGDGVSRELSRFGPAAGMADLVRIWPEAVGEAIAANALPARISRDGTAHIATSSSTWAFELAQLEPTLVERLREHLGPAAPPRLRFAPGRLPEPAGDAAGEAAKRRIEASPAHLAMGAELASQIRDEELRNLVAKAAAASLARADSDRSF